MFWLVSCLVLPFVVSLPHQEQGNPEPRSWHMLSYIRDSLTHLTSPKVRALDALENVLPDVLLGKRAATTSHVTNATNSKKPPIVNCNNLSTGLSNNCWAELDLTDWVIAWQQNTVCLDGEGFASCFLRQSAYPGLDCTTISLSSCPPPVVLTGMDPRNFYVSYNIYGMCGVHRWYRSAR